MQYFDGNKDKKLTWSALLFGDEKGLTGGGKADSTDDACLYYKRLSVVVVVVLVVGVGVHRK